jgi:hypothetical protein
LSVSALRTLREAAKANTRRASRTRNVFVDQRTLDAAKTALGPETETATDVTPSRGPAPRGVPARSRGPRASAGAACKRGLSENSSGSE